MKAAAIETQVCTKCGLEKPLSKYYFRKDSQKYRSACNDCLAKQKKAKYQANPEPMKARVKAWREANPEKARATRKAYYQNNIEKIRAKGKAHYQANSEVYKARTKARYKANVKKISIEQKARYEAKKEEYKLRIKAYRKANKQKVNAWRAKRRAAKLNATPAWADNKKIAQIYKECPPGYHVDHVFPLQSPIMCGLHVENNLQYLPAKENIKKKNHVTLQQQLNG